MSTKTFIHHDGALGDVLLSLPCFREIRKTAGHLTLACRPDVAALLKDMGWVDEAYSADNRLYASLYTDRVDQSAEQFLDRFSRAFLFTVRRDSSLAGHLQRIIPQTAVIITIPPEGERTHAADYRMQQLARKPVPEDEPLVMDVPVVTQEQARRLLRERGFRNGEQSLTVLHPGSGGRNKCWPIENYLSLADRFLRNGNRSLVILSGPAEDYGMREHIERFVGTRRRALHLHDNGLGTVAALLSMSTLYMGNDSGITHLAAAVGAPVLALFGPTDPVVWGPRGARVQVVSAPAPEHVLESLSVEEVGETAERRGQSANATNDLE